MTKLKYKALRTKMYKAVGQVGTLAEGSSKANLSVAYQKMSEGLDAIDMLGSQLGFLDPTTNNWIDGRRKKSVETTNIAESV